MSWEIYTGLIIFTNIYALLKIAEILKASEENETQASIVNGLKIFFISTSLILSAVAMGASSNVIDLSISNNVTDVPNVAGAMNTIYKGMMFTYIPYILMLLIMFIAVVLSAFKMKKAREEQ